MLGVAEPGRQDIHIANARHGGEVWAPSYCIGAKIPVVDDLGALQILRRLFVGGRQLVPGVVARLIVGGVHHLHFGVSAVLKLRATDANAP